MPSAFLSNPPGPSTAPGTVQRSTACCMAVLIGQCVHHLQDCKLALQWGSFQGGQPDSAHLTPILLENWAITLPFLDPGVWPCRALELLLSPGPQWSASQGLTPRSTSHSPERHMNAGWWGVICLALEGHHLWKSCS